VFKKIQALFGGKVDIVITGSAPLEAEVLTFFRCALGCVVCRNIQILMLLCYV
jgi:long-chain acyl-CoA synthetase